MSDLYELPNGWEWKKLGDLAEYINGMAFKPTDWVDSGYPIIRIQNLNGSNDFNYFNGDAPSKYYVKDGDILISWSASLDVYKWNRGNAILNQHIFNTIINTNVVDYDFFYHTIKYSLTEIEKNLHGVGMKHITKGKFENIDIPLPPLSEQQRIVSKLDSLFEKIDKAIALHQKNIDEADAFMGSALNEAFGELEEKYETVELTKYVNFSGGSQPPKSEFSDVPLEGYVRLIQIRDYKTDNHIVYVKRDSVRKFCTKDDVMIGRYGPPVFQILRGIDGAYNVALMKAVPNEEVVSKDYLFNFLKNPKIQNYIIGLSQRAAGQSGVNKDALEKYLIPIPSLPIQQKVVNYLDDLSDKIESVKVVQKEKMDSLKALKASILDKAFGGEL